MCEEMGHAAEVELVVANGPLEARFWSLTCWINCDTGQFDPEWRCWAVFGRRSHSGVPGAGPASGVGAAGFGRVAAASVAIVVVDELSSITSMMGHSMVLSAAVKGKGK